MASICVHTSLAIKIGLGWPACLALRRQNDGPTLILAVSDILNIVSAPNFLLVQETPDIRSPSIDISTAHHARHNIQHRSAGLQPGISSANGTSDRRRRSPIFR